MRFIVRQSVGAGVESIQYAVLVSTSFVTLNCALNVDEAVTVCSEQTYPPIECNAVDRAAETYSMLKPQSEHILCTGDWKYRREPKCLGLQLNQHFEVLRSVGDSRSFPPQSFRSASITGASPP